jgi:hypothetical protein
LYDHLIGRSALLEGLQHGRQTTPVTHCDATCYFDDQPIMDRVLKVGEASFCLDRLSSQGVRSAMGSALHGSLVLNTLISRPQDASAASELFVTRDNRRQS